MKKDLSTRTVVLHDVDRDGLGSAAMICAEFGPKLVRLIPTKPEDLEQSLTQREGEVNQNMLILDLPAPKSWDYVPTNISITWVDHHLDSWRTTHPTNVKTILPMDRKPTTTMSLLVKHKLVSTPNVMQYYVRRLCGEQPEFDWAHVFDTLDSTYPYWSIDHDDLPHLLALGPKGEEVPEELLPLVHRGLAIKEQCGLILDDAPTQLDDYAVIVEIAEAKGISLKNFSMEAQRRYPNLTTILVHRNSTLYCGRESRKEGLNFINHFQTRGLDPVGHQYVTSVRIPKNLIRSELDVLLTKLKEFNLR